MALTSDTFVRPAATSTNNEAIVLAGVMLEDTAATPDNITLDIKATVAAAARLIHRVKVTPEYSGTQGRLKIEYLWFGLTTTTYADAKTTPFTDAEADANVVLMGYTPWKDLDAQWTLYGDART